MDVPLSDSDIKKLLNNNTTIVFYDKIPTIPNVKTLLDMYTNAVIYYPMTPQYGHWCCLIYSFDEKGNKIIEFFDPYGKIVDNAMKHSQVPLPPYLAKLLLTSPYPVHYNNFTYQKSQKGINTCGRHVVNRIWNQVLPLRLYNYIFGNENVDSDKLVTFLTKKKLTY